MDRTGEFSEDDIEYNKGISALGYFGLAFIVPLLAAGDSKFAKFHANQGAVLCLNEFILIVFILISNVLASVTSSLMFGFLAFLLAVALFVFSVTGIIIGVASAARGKAKELPIIGKMTLFK